MGRLDEIQELKREKVMLEMKKEIETLEYALNHRFVNDIKRDITKKTKKSLVYARKLLPLFVSMGITAGALSYISWTPFKLDNQKRYKEIKTIMDSNNNIRYEEQYNSYDDQNRIKNYGKWEKVEDNLYKRSVVIHSIPNEIDTLEGVEKYLETTGSQVVEYKNNISEEELEADGYIEGEFYSKNKNDYVIVKESKMDNIGTTALWFVANMYIGLVILGTGSNYDYLQKIKDIEEQYKEIDYYDLANKLQIKRDNYNRLK